MKKINNISAEEIRVKDSGICWFDEDRLMIKPRKTIKGDLVEMIKPDSIGVVTE